MRLDFISLFPEMFESVLGSSILKRAAEAVANPADASAVREPVVSYHLHNPRDFADNKHNKIDARPYGGGAGMVMQCQPIFDCVMAAEAQDPEIKATRIAVTPTGVPLNQKLVEELSKKPRLVILCGHYEGFDQRVLDELEPMEVSLGDYVLTGGELPAMVLADAIIRLIPGVIGKPGSHEQDSFSPGVDRLLDHPHFTRPPEWRGRNVPDVLLSGDHKKIEQWRREQSLELTQARRPDLLSGPLGGALHEQSISTVILRDAGPGDHGAIDALLRNMFDTDAEANLVCKLREQGDAPIELVAEAPAQVGSTAGHNLIGHAVFSPVSIQNSDGRLRSLALSSLAVSESYRDHGIGKALIQQGLRACEDARAGAVFMLVDPEDELSAGFESAADLGFSSTMGGGQALMIKLLKPLVSPPGMVQYAPAFDAM
ncbi:MAG: tRNA (guanosine(37)-N1)-methyltransferase TrmD [Phycisphaeraceae bacterium]